MLLFAVLGLSSEAMATRLIFVPGPQLLPAAEEACFVSDTLVDISDLEDIFAPADFGCEEITDLRASAMCETIPHLPEPPEGRLVMRAGPLRDITPHPGEMCIRWPTDPSAGIECAEMTGIFGHFVCPAPAGTIEVSLSPETPNGAVIVAEDDDEVAIFNLRALDENMEVTELGVHIDDRGHTVDAWTMLSEIEVCLSDRCEWMVPTGPSNTVRFEPPVIIEDGELSTVRILAKVGTIARMGGLAEAQAQFSITFDGDSLLARGVDSGVSPIDVEVVGDVSGETFALMEGSFTQALSATSPTGRITPRPDQKVICVNVTAHASEGVQLNHIPVAVFATDVAGTDWNNCNAVLGLTGDSFQLIVDEVVADASFTLRDAGGDICDPTAGFGDGENVGSIVIEPVGGITVSAGVTRTYCVHMDTTNMGPDSLQMSIRPDLTDPYHGDITAGELTEDDLSPFDRLITVSTPWLYAEGDILCMDTDDDGCDAWDERMLVTIVDDGELTVIRGYGGTSTDGANRNDLGDDINIVGRALLWTGTSDPSAGPDQYFGGYMLPQVDGNVLIND